MPFTTSDYIITRLAQQNVEAIFGVPAVYCAPVFEAAANTANFRVVVTSSDLVAGYAADGYARTRGLSAVSVAYGVGTLSLLNAVAGAYIERSPVVVINGGPSQARIDQQNNTGILFSHSMGQPHSDLEAFRPFTCFAERATSQAGLPALIDRAIVAALTKKHRSILKSLSRGLERLAPARADRSIYRCPPERLKPPRGVSSRRFAMRSSRSSSSALKFSASSLLPPCSRSSASSICGGRPPCWQSPRCRRTIPASSGCSTGSMRRRRC